jgi:hypothetical protein
VPSALRTTAIFPKSTLPWVERKVERLLRRRWPARQRTVERLLRRRRIARQRKMERLLRRRWPARQRTVERLLRRRFSTTRSEIAFRLQMATEMASPARNFPLSALRFPLSVVCIGPSPAMSLRNWPTLARASSRPKWSLLRSEKISGSKIRGARAPRPARSAPRRAALPIHDSRFTIHATR